MTVWLSERLVLAMHSQSLARHGGADGIRDPGLLESALARPLNRAGYGEPDVVELAALYAVAIARNHPFIDGNKRTAYLALEVFSGAERSQTDGDGRGICRGDAGDGGRRDEGRRIHAVGP